jgi:Tol biopolymer transport system component
VERAKARQPDVYVQQIGSGSPVRLTTDRKNDYNSVWSPDDRWIAFLRRDGEAGRREVRLIPPLGGPERKLADIRVRDTYFIIPPYLAWCPESNCLIVTESPGEGKPDALFIVALERGGKRRLTNPQPPAFGDTNPTISPDARWLVYRRHPNKEAISVGRQSLYRPGPRVRHGFSTLTSRPAGPRRWRTISAMYTSALPHLGTAARSSILELTPPATT